MNKVVTKIFAVLGALYFLAVIGHYVYKYGKQFDHLWEYGQVIILFILVVGLIIPMKNQLLPMAFGLELLEVAVTLVPFFRYHEPLRTQDYLILVALFLLLLATLIQAFPKAKTAHAAFGIMGFIGALAYIASYVMEVNWMIKQGYVPSNKETWLNGCMWLPGYFFAGLYMIGAGFAKDKKAEEEEPEMQVAVQPAMQENANPYLQYMQPETQPVPPFASQAQPEVQPAVQPIEQAPFMQPLFETTVEKVAPVVEENIQAEDVTMPIEEVVEEVAAPVENIMPVEAAAVTEDDDDDKTVAILPKATPVQEEPAVPAFAQQAAPQPMAQPQQPVPPYVQPPVGVQPQAGAMPGMQAQQPMQPQFNQSMYGQPMMNAAACVRCGTRLVPDALFCPNCGQRR